ncbi:hypothetical protein RZO55_05560 [Clostridium boliviensis]|uniref:Phage tail tape measure protein n=1 Tax=Clostridium boliviensis TaxID=318465 RepID=A0ABU4GHF6_9CLOT|nr:hypothetical protein [Clostridium boliviensis]MDW2797046.1 hypothetical protein [Clostridium boliviensis]
MADNDSMIKLTAALEKEKSTKQINQDIKALEKTISQLHLMAVLYKGESRKELDTSIEELEKKVKAIKLKTTVDVRSITKELDGALQNVTLKDIKINNLGMKLAARKVAQIITGTLERYIALPKIELKQDQFHMDISGIQKNLSMVAAGFDLAVSGIIKFRKAINTSKEITSLFNEISKLSGIASEDVQKLSEVSLQAAGTYGKSIKEYLEGVLAVLKNSQVSISGQEEQLIQVFQSMDSLFENSTITWENRLISMQNAWDGFVYSLMNADSSGGSSFLFQTILSVETLYQYLNQIPQKIAQLSASPALAATVDLQVTTKSENISGNETKSGAAAFDIKGIMNSASDFKDISKSVDELEEKLIKSQYGFNSLSSAIAESHENLRNYLDTCTNEDPPSLEGYQQHLNEAGVQTDLLRAKTIMLNLAFTAVSAIGMQLVTMGIQAIGKAIYNQQHQTDIAAEAAANAKQELADIQSDVDGLNSKLQTTSQRINELKSKDSITLVEQEELQNLTATNEELKNQLKIKKALENIAAEDSNKKSEDYFKSKQSYKKFKGMDDVYLPDDSMDAYKSPDMRKKNSTPLDRLKDELADYQELESLYEDVVKQKSELDNSDQKSTGDYQKLASLGMQKSDIETELEKLKNHIKESVPEIQENLAALDPDKNKDLINQAQQSLDDFTQEFGSSEPVLPLKVSLDLDTDKNQIDEMIKKAADGGLTTADISANLLVKSDMSPEDFISAFNLEFEKEIGNQKNENFKNSLSEISAGKLEEYINYLNSGDLNQNSITSFEDLNKIMKETGVSAENAFNNLKEFSKDYVTSSDLTSGMETTAQLIGSVKQEFADTKNVATSSLNAISKKFPQLSGAVLEYSQGAIHYDDLIKQLEDAYAEDSEAYRLNIVYKLQFDESFFSVVRDRNQRLFEDLAKAYGDDLKNWNNLVRAKSGINTGFRNKLSNILGGSSENSLTPDELYDKYITVNKDNTISVKEEMRNKYSKIQGQTLDKEISKYNENVKKLDDAAESQIVIPEIPKVSPKSTPAVSGSNTSSTSQPPQEINWIEREEKMLDEARTRLKEASSDSNIDYLGVSEKDFNRAKAILNSTTAPTIEQLNELKEMTQKSGLSMDEFYKTVQGGTWSASRQSLLDKLVDADKLSLEKQKEITSQYQKQYEDMVANITPEYRSKIENGSLSVEQFSGKEAEVINKAISAYDKLTASKNKVNELNKAYTEDFMASYENRYAALEAENEQIKNSSSLIEKQIAYIKSSGEVVDSSLYKKLMNLSGQEELVTKEILANKRKELQDMLNQDRNSENSESYLKLKEDINKTESSLYDLKKAQEEYNFQLLKLPIEHLETVGNMYKDIQSAMENWSGEMESSGKKADSGYYQGLISNGLTLSDQLREQGDLIERAMDNYEAGSDNWNELYGKLQNVNSEMSSMVQSLHKWNEELLKMPLDKLSASSTDMQKISEGLEALKSDYDTAINAVTGAINEQIASINKQKDAVNEEYESSKKSLQDKLDLLNKQNDKLKLQQKYEQSLYDLQKANQQATEKVIRNGEVVYEQDSDKLRAAKEAVQDAKFDLETNEIQSQIDSLQETLDGLNDTYQDQIDSLQKISDKWSEINEKITKAQNDAKADEILGTGWKDKILSGKDDSLYQNLNGLYTGITQQISAYKDQIESTEKIYTLLENYIASYKEGTLTYNQALTGINNLLSQLNQKMSPTENLQNLYDYYASIKGTDADGLSILAGFRQGLQDSASELIKSLEQYNKNYGTISEYTSSWQQLTDNVASMLHVLKDVRDNLESSEDSEDEEDSVHSNGEPYMGGGYVNGGPGDTRKDGISKGLIGATSASARETKMKLLGLKSMDSDEFASILHRNEAVFNTEQQDMLLSNLEQAWNFTPGAGTFIMDSGTKPHQAITNFEFGGIQINECSNPDELAKGILNGGLKSAIIQQTGKH